MLLIPPNYGLCLRIYHPNISPYEITNCLGLTPERFWMVGDQRNTPTGRVLEGVNKFTYWCHSFEAIDNIGPNELFQHIFEKLLPNMRFFETLVSTGGKSEIYFTIHGHENGGDTLKWAVLEYFVKLKINLSVEFFP